MALRVADLDVTKREVLRGLLRGASADDLAWAASRSPEEVLALCHQALVDLDPELAGELAADERRHVSDYLLRRQSAGQAAGTWELLERSAAARRWALWLRESLDGLYAGEPPPLPRVDGDERAAAGPPAGADEPEEETLERSREDRDRRRTKAEIGKAVKLAASPFRHEAVEHYREAETEIRLPHFATRPARLAMYGLLGLLVVAFVLTASVKVPTFRSAKALVVDVPQSADRPLRGLSILVLLKPGVRRSLHEGQVLRVQLPDTGERVSTRLAYVEPTILSPEEITRRYGLDAGDSNRVRGPSAVALAELRVPPGSPPRRTFAGAVTSQADVRTGETRIISLVL